MIIPMPSWIEVLGGTGLMSLLLLIIGNQNKKIDNKMEKDMCSQRCDNTDKVFDSIAKQQNHCYEKFEQFNRKIDKQAEMLTRVETILDIAAKKNGWH